MLVFNNEKEELYTRGFCKWPERMANRLDRRDKGQEKLQENVDLKQLCLREWGGHDILVGGT